MRCLSRFVSVAALAATAIANSYSRRWSARAIGFGDDHCFFLTILTRTPIGRSYIVSSRLLNAVRTLRSNGGGRPSWEESRHAHPLAESEGFLSLSHKRSRKIIAT
jgi:hypothetical protein